MGRYKGLSWVEMSNYGNLSSVMMALLWKQEAMILFSVLLPGEN